MDISDKKITLNEALKMASEGETIYLGNRIFIEKIYVEKKNIELVGNGAIITFCASHGTIIPKKLGGDGIKTYGTTGSATFTVKKEGEGFKASGITFENSFKRNGAKNGQAVAFKSETSHIRIEKCRFISEQDTLYIDEGINNEIKDSSISGDVDFVFGSAQCKFTNCTFLGINNGYFIAPDTYDIYPSGFTFIDSRFLLAENASLSLGRPWFPGGAKHFVYPKAKFIRCEFDSKIDLKMIRMHDTDPIRYELDFEDCKLQ